MHGGDSSNRFGAGLVTDNPCSLARPQLRVSTWLVRALPLLCLSLLCALEWLAVLSHTRGTFTYSLDDPYIHLALAENIARGTYGVNLGEVSAPSSSLLWPFLLAPFALTSWASLLPLIINLIASACTTELVYAFLRASFPARSTRANVFLALASVVFIASTNMVGVAFTGMEHSLQVLGVVSVLYGAKREESEGRLHGWTLFALTLLPLVRYESLTFVAPMGWYFLRRGYVRSVLVAGASSVAALGLFSLFLRSHGLGFLPTSVEAKSNLSSSAFERASTIVRRGWEDPHVFTFFVFAFVFVLLAMLARTKRARDLGLALAGATLAHLYIGNFGWFDRYEIYLYAAQILGLTWLLAGPLHSLDVGVRFRVSALALTAGLMISGSYLVRPLQTPAAARNMHEQQRQMHHFAADLYGKSVAVNDLGLVSFRNDAYVLDLSGLASREALLASRTEPPRVWRERLVRAHDVGLAMIYDPGAHSVPLSWTALGTLKLAGPLVTAYLADVEFFATNSLAIAELRPLLERFRAELPAGVTFAPPKVVDCLPR